MRKHIEKRGGKRAGAGRKKVLPGCIRPTSVRITEEQTAMLEEWGNGNLSAGLRWLIDAAAVFVRLPPLKEK